MPYATPTSPIPSPVKETSHRKGWLTPPTHIEDMEAGPSYTTGPMPGIPRRSSSNHSAAASGSTTPRRVASPPGSRQPSSSGIGLGFAASKPMEGLPRRSSSSQGTQGAFGVTGLPHLNEAGSLGLKLLPSPTKAPHMQRGVKDSISSVSTVESSLPSTPADEPGELPIPSLDNDAKTDQSATPSPGIPFPSFEPPVLRPVPSPLRTISQANPSRPAMAGARRSTGLGHHRGNGPVGRSLQLPNSASTSHIVSRTIDSSSLLRPTASMIRKKSGEVVKPSLKVRSMSTPDLTRQGNGAPTTPVHEDTRGFPDERSKSVRFADGDDGDPQALERVVLFSREQKPTAVGKAADPDHVGAITDTETEADDTDASDFVQFRTRRNAAARAADEAGQIMLEGGSRVPRLRTDFSPDARGSLNGENVVMERVELVTGPGPLCMRGTVIVRNVAFQKWVSVRFTLDHWQTRSEVSADHVCHIPSSTTGDEGWDRFGFTVKLEDFKRKIEDRQLILCVRFSIGGQEWWDSNNGMNYNFTFRKGPPRRPARTSGPAAMGGGFMRLSEPASTSIAGLRQRISSPGSEISRAFGVAPSSAKSGGPRDWTFPKFAAQRMEDGAKRSDSPVQLAPPTAYRVPAPPDVHTHLSLSKYCAPSPPQSPPKETAPDLVTPDGSLILESPSAAESRLEMSVMGGQFATLSPPSANPDHDRRASWNGQSESWDSFAKAMEVIDDTPQQSTDGDSTPVAGSQSPTVKADSSGDSSPIAKPLAFKRSTGDLRALLDHDETTGLLTPPPSNLSSPPSPSAPTLPAEPYMSPSSATSSLSTGDSSPVNTVSTADSITDLANLAIDVDPEERGRSLRTDYKMLNNHSYQDFLDKFCFFTSPRMTPNDEPTYTRPTYIPLSGTVSPNGFPFFANATNASNSPRNTPTPTRNYDSAGDAFGFSNQQVNGDAHAHAIASANGPSTPKASPPKASPMIGVTGPH